MNERENSTTKSLYFPGGLPAPANFKIAVGGQI